MTVVIGCLILMACLNAYLVWQLNETNKRWMMMFSAQQGIPLPNMDGKHETPTARTPARERKRFPVPIPGADWMRKNPN